MKVLFRNTIQMATARVGNHHDDTEGSPNHAPADILQQPEYDVQVLHLPETEGNIVGLFCGHIEL